MDWARAFFAPGAPREPAPEPETLVDPSFTEADSRLEELWRAYYDSTLATDVAKRDANFDKLVELFLDRYQHWHPDRGAEGGTTSTTGHPVLVLGALGCYFKTTVQAACEAAGRPYDGTSWALPRPELLYLLAVLSRSGSNRRSLLRWDVHTSAVRLLKALCKQMNALAADVGPQGIWEWTDVQGWWTELEGWLRAALQILTNYVDPTASWRLRCDFEPVDWSAPLHEKGDHANAPLGATEVATASIVDGALPALVEGLAALRHILLQAQFCRERHDLLDELLRLLGAAVSCNPERQASIVAQPVGTDLLRVVLDCIGWAHHQGFNIPLPAGVQRSDLVLCTYSSQLLLLRVLCELLHFHPTNIDSFMQNGRSKVVETLLWVCASFCNPTDLSGGEGSAAGTNRVVDPVTLGTAPGFHAPRLPACEQVETCLHWVT